MTTSESLHTSEGSHSPRKGIRRLASAVLSFAGRAIGKEHKAPPHDPKASISEAAKNVGLELDPKRLEFLVSLTETRKYEGEAFFSDGLIVTDPRSDEDGKTRAKIDFTLSGFDTQLGTAYDDPYKNTFQGIRALQHYMLLADAGYIQPPDVLYGQTNPETAKAAQKLFGFSAREGRVSEIEAPFKNVHDAAFSDRTNILYDRLHRHLYPAAASSPHPPAPTNNIQIK